MKKYLYPRAIIFSAVFTLLCFFSYSPTQAAGLSEAQVQAVLNLLVAFQVDAPTIANVNTILHGGAPSSSLGGALILTRDLSMGARGDEVTNLQRFLIAQGLLTADSATGYFGPLTRAAVVAFQSAHGIPPLGGVGPLTRATIAKILSPAPLPGGTASNGGGSVLGASIGGGGVARGKSRGGGGSGGSGGGGGGGGDPTTPPAVSLFINPASVVRGGSATLTWATTDATSCTASGAWSGSKATSGSQVFTNLTTSATYIIACTGPGGSVEQSATIAVTPLVVVPHPAIAFSAAPATITQGNSSRLAWLTKNATSCAASGGWSGSKATTSSQSVSPTTNTTYTLTCTGPGGSATQSTTVTVSTPTTPSITITSSPSSITSGSASTITWSSTNATSCTASGGWSGSKNTSGSQSVSPTANTTYTLTCTGSGGSANQSSTITVTAPPAPLPTVTFAASPTSVIAGNSSTLTWSSTNATSCSASGGWSGSKPASGSQVMSNLTGTQTYTITCSGAGGSADKSATVTVTPLTPPPAPAISFSVSPLSITSGQSSTLTWSSTNSTSCTASGGWSGSKNTSGTQSVSPTTNTTYTLTCTGSGGSTNQSVTVNVTTAPPSNGVWPNTSNTGVPAGTVLTAYTGPVTITTNNTVIDSKTITGNLDIRASGVLVKNSRINGTIGTDENSSGYSFTIQDSEVNVGNREGTGVGAVNFTVLRVHVTGGNRSMNCWKNCDVRDSYVHGQFRDASGVAHESGIRQGSDNKIIHNTILCDAPDVPPDAGCSADLTGYGDFAVVERVLVQNNWFKPTTGGYCAYGGSSAGKPYSSGTNNIQFIGNVFERGTRNGDHGVPTCGYYGSITAFDPSRPGNVWSGNKWDDGRILNSDGSTGGSAPPPSNPAATVSLSASPSSITTGNTSTLSWSSSNATSCSASGGWSGSKNTSGSQSVSPTSNTTYSLSCTGSGGSGSQSTTIVVSAVTPPPGGGGGGSGTPVSIFTSQTPQLLHISDGPGTNYELGTRFTSTQAGQITAIRFWKDSSESGTHTGRIWSSSGTQLASVVFSGESASGWQTQNLASPLTIAANTTYTVSVNTGNTYYVASNNGLASAVSNGALSTVVGSNGRYGPAGAHPTTVYQASNYFRDVVFVPSSSAFNGSSLSAGVGLAFPTASSGGLISKQVKTTANLNVRATPNGALVSTQAQGAVGTIEQGPQLVGGYTWWFVRYSNGTAGWSAGNYLSF